MPRIDLLPESAETEPELMRVRRRLERTMEDDLRRLWGGPLDVTLGEGFFAWVASFEGPSLARFVHTEASREQVLDLFRVRSLYHLKETDPTTWVIPRLPATARARWRGCSTTSTAPATRAGCTPVSSRAGSRPVD